LGVRFALLALLAFGCTRSNPQAGGNPDLYVAPIGDLAGIYDLTATLVDLAAVLPDLSGTDLASRDLAAPRDLSRPDLGGGPCVRVNEISPGNGLDAADEYVELVNVCDAEVRLDGWSLRYRSAINNGGTQNVDTTQVSFGAFAFAAHSYLIFSGGTYAGVSDGKLATGISGVGGGLAVVDNLNGIVDSVAYGSVVPEHNYI
jgi:hypothetical protein